MEKKKNVFSRLLNKIKAFSNKYLDQDIKTAGEVKLTLEQREQVAETQRVEAKIHKEKNSGFVLQGRINEAQAVVDAEEKARNSEPQAVQHEYK